MIIGNTIIVLQEITESDVFDSALLIRWKLIYILICEIYRILAHFS